MHAEAIMLRFFLKQVALVALLLTFPLAAAAQAPASVTTDPAKALGAPVELPPGVSPAEMPLGGSWRQTCANARLVSDPAKLIFRLTASCRKIDGSMNETAVDPGSCGQPATFGNQDGVLVCESGPRKKNLFPGSDAGWIGECINESMSGTFLSALCPDAGGAVRSSLDITTCAPPGRIDFANGRLFCASGARIPPIGGNWIRSCIRESMSGTTLTAMCLTPAGGWVVTSLDVGACNAPATAGNEGGVLACESGMRPTEVAADPAPVASTDFGDVWTIVTERGDSFSLDMKQTANAVSGSVTFWDKPLRLNGSVLAAGEKVALVWQYSDFAGTGELTMAASKQELSGKLLMGDGSTLQGGTWKGTRRGGGPARPEGAADLPQEATTAPGAGYERAVSTTGLSIRDKPTSKGSQVLGALKPGEVVAVRCPADNRNWCELEDGRGWVYRQYLNMGPQASVTPPPARATTTTAGRQEPGKNNGNSFLHRILGNQ
jgi:hypothetical protein